MQAKSGTGKTCVFATIALDAVLLESPATQVSRPGEGTAPSGIRHRGPGDTALCLNHRRLSKPPRYVQITALSAPSCGFEPPV